ncbi:hypothetical protein N9B94_04800, partial [Verrucomicrobia bacterium]|nr:hypothetical protein [Verrucomicrobiota bacterium]
GGMTILDVFRELKGADGRVYLQRELELQSNSKRDELFFRVAVDRVVEQLTETRFRIGKSLQIHLPPNGGIRTAKNGFELILPFKGRTRAIIEYHWEQ